MTKPSDQRRWPLVAPPLLWQMAFFALPLVTVKIMAAIHWQALRLWLKGARLVPRTALGSKTGLASGNSSDYTSPVLSTRAHD